jgi:hypothetical protein
MKQKVNITVMLLALTGMFACKEEFPAQEVIVGKWLLTAYGPSEDKVKPAGEGFIKLPAQYEEFLPNGIRNRYLIATGECSITGSYKIDSKYLYLDYVNELGHFEYEYQFIDNDRIKLTYVKGLMLTIYGYPTIYVYQRIK